MPNTLTTSVPPETARPLSEPSEPSAAAIDPVAEGPVAKGPRPSYPSDLSEGQWRRLAPLIPPEKHRGRSRRTDVREVVNAIRYRWSTGCVWRMLPHDFPPWATVYTYFRQWREDGTLDAIRRLLKGRPSRPADRAR